jgi:hypothetical protein
MRSEYLVIALLIALIGLAAALLLVAVYVSTPHGPAPGNQITETIKTTTPSTTSTTTRQTPSTTTRKASTSGASSLEMTTTVSTTTTTTTTLILPQLTLEIPDTTVFKNEDVTIRVLSDGSPVADATIILDGELKETSGTDGRTVLYALRSGNHTIDALKDGYQNASVNITVQTVSYAASSEIRIQHTPDERAQAIAEGKVVLIFYDSPNCPNCALMRPMVADIVNNNRQCISYELLNLYNQGPSNELHDLMEGFNKTTVATPVIVIEGDSGKIILTGFHYKTDIEDRLIQAESERCQIQ